MLAALAVIVAWLWPSGQPDEADDADAYADVGASPMEPDLGAVAVAHVQGEVFVEVPRPPPDPVVQVVLDSAGGTTAGWAVPPQDWSTGPTFDDGDATGGSETSGGEPVPPTPPPVDLHPPAGCTVTGWQEGERVTAPSSCAPDGRYEVAMLPGRSGRTAFEILVPDHLRAVVEVDVPASGTSRLPAVALGQGQRVTGQVVDGAGTPLPGIVLTAMPDPNLGEPEPWRATSETDGSFVFDTLPPGPVTLRAQAPGHATSVVEVLSPQADLLVTLEALVDLRGRVVGSPTALSRAVVRIEGSGVWPVREQAAAADGSFVLTEIPEGIYALEAVVAAVGPDDPELASIPLENVTPELSITLALVPAFRVPVEVQAPDGTPVEGARVTLSNASVGLLPRLASTDREGFVAIGPVVPGPYVVRAHADGWLPTPPIAVTVEGPDVALQVLTLALPGRIEGTVVDDEGHPVEGARVELFADHLFTAGEGQARARFAQAALQTSGSLGVTTGPVPEVPLRADAAADLGSTVRSNAEGRFVFEMLTPGRYRLEAGHGRYARSEVETVRLSGGGTRAGVRLVLRTGHRVTGRVRDGNDRPVDGALVRLSDGRRTTTNARGLFDVGIVRGRHQLVASAEGLAPRAVDVDVRDEPVDVEIVLGRARARLSGRVEGGNGEVLPDARVTLRVVDGLSPSEITWTDAKGLYAFDDLPPGAVEIEVDHREHGPQTRTARLPATDSEVRVDVQLSRGWTLEVDVLTEGGGDPLVGVSVEGGGVRARTDDRGRATLDRLSDERVQVEVHAPGYGLRRFAVDRDGADRRSRRVELAEGGGLRGRVTDYRGEPVAGVVVVVLDAEEQELSRARTDGRGRWSVSGVPAGDVLVQADPPASREDELASDAQSTDVLRGHVTRGVDLRFDRR